MSTHWKMIFIFCLLFLGVFSQVSAQQTARQRCTSDGIQPRPANFEPGGIILTMFDSTALWVYDIDRNRRYPLPDTHPCDTNCRLSPDAMWITYPTEGDFIKMRLDGSERITIATNASDVEWWSADTFLVWTPEHAAYLQSSDENLEYLDADGVVLIQPNGYWGMTLQTDGDGFRRVLVNLQAPDDVNQHIELGMDSSYFNASAWSPDGEWLVYSAQSFYDSRNQIAGAELFGVHPGDSESIQLTDLDSLYGAVRINGHTVGQLSWSPDSTRIAFWVTELLGPDYLTNTGNAVIHLLDVTTGALTVYCGFSTIEHTPNPPRLVWSPDGTHIAFGGNLQDDNRGYLLLVMDTVDGSLTELSEGVFPMFGSPDIIAWGLFPD
jgi:WD40 repeat protein